MRLTLIKLFILPGGVALLIGLSLLSLILIYSPLPRPTQQAKQEREEFPHQRRGGGTHWDNRPDDVA